MKNVKKIINNKMFSRLSTYLYPNIIKRTSPLSFCQWIDNVPTFPSSSTPNILNSYIMDKQRNKNTGCLRYDCV